MKNVIIRSATIIVVATMLIACTKKSKNENYADVAAPAYNAEKLPIGADGCSNLVARIRTAKGNIDFCFYAKIAPALTNRLLQLIDQGFYDGIRFHRMIPGQIVQTGDPSNSGSGGSNQTIVVEGNNLAIERGSVVMAMDSSSREYDSQFYFALTAIQATNTGVVFGKVLSGIDVLELLSPEDRLIFLVLIDEGN